VLPECGDKLSSVVVVREVTLVSAAPTAAVSQPAAKIAQALVFRTLGTLDLRHRCRTSMKMGNHRDSFGSVSGGKKDIWSAF